MFESRNEKLKAKKKDFDDKQERLAKLLEQQTEAIGMAERLNKNLEDLKEFKDIANLEGRDANLITKAVEEFQEAINEAKIKGDPTLIHKKSNEIISKYGRKYSK